MGNKIRKIKLNNGQVYSFFDSGALRLDDENRLVIDDLTSPTGVSFIDELIINGNLSIIEVDDVPVTDDIDNVLVQDTTTGEIKKRTTDKLLEDIGGTAYQMDDSTGTLSLKIGKFE